jgi:hypothetical protein
MKRAAFVPSMGALLLASCATSVPLVEPINRPLPQNVSQVANGPETAIIQALQSLGWVVVARQPGRVTSQIELRGRHRVKIAVDYASASYSIRYLDSEGVDYDPATGEIHRNWDRWMRNLEARIQRTSWGIALPPLTNPAADAPAVGGALTPNP